MAEMWEKRHKVVVGRGSWNNNPKTEEQFRTMAMVSKVELIAYLNKYNAKPKMIAKVIRELDKRGVKIVWS
jgi:predicted phosphatase